MQLPLGFALNRDGIKKVIGYTLFKGWARRFLPERALESLGRVKARGKVAYARAVFANGKNRLAPLPIGLIDSLAQNYAEPPKIRYDPDGLVLRAEKNVERIRRWIDLKGVRSALEIGCWGGMVAARVRRDVERCYALDLSRRGFDARARAAGVDFVQADATHFPFESRAFDLVFSFAAFEHFPEPARVMQEIARVLRPGGFFHLEFGPIATAPYGLHAYRDIPVPYLQILFDGADLRRYTRERGLSADWPFINGLGLRDYRRMFEASKCDFKILACDEWGTAGGGAELIARYPGVFRRVSDNFDDFLISGMVVCLQRL